MNVFYFLDIHLVCMNKGYSLHLFKVKHKIFTRYCKSNDSFASIAFWQILRQFSISKSINKYHHVSPVQYEILSK